MRLCFLFLFVSGIVSGQAFEVVSVKIAKPGTRGSGIVPTPAGIKMQNVTVKEMIAEAYHVYDMQIAGGPNWMEADRFDVEAKGPGDRVVGKEQRRAMMRTMPQERFGLGVHENEQVMQAFLLEPGKNGSKLAVTKDPTIPAFFRVYQRRQITSANAPLDYLVEALTWMIGRPVLDRTGWMGLMTTSWSGRRMSCRCGRWMRRCRVMLPRLRAKPRLRSNQRWGNWG